MCDEHFEEDLDNYTRVPPLTRRQFATLSMGAGVAVMLPRAADALQVAESDVTVKTPAERAWSRQLALFKTALG